MQKQDKNLLAVSLKGAVVFLDVQQMEEKSQNLLFVKNRYGLLGSLLLVIIVFFVNELRPESVQRSNRLFIGLLYFLFVSLIISVLTE